MTSAEFQRLYAQTKDKKATKKKTASVKMYTVSCDKETGEQHQMTIHIVAADLEVWIHPDNRKAIERYKNSFFI